MFVYKPEAAGTVVALLGKAVARGPDGSLRMLGIGDRVGEDEVILTAQNGYVQLASGSSGPGRSSPVLSTASPKVVALATSEGEVAPQVPPEGSGSGLQSALRLEGASGGDGFSLSSLVTPALPTETASRAVPGRSAAVDRFAPLADAGRYTVAEDTALPLAIGGRDPDGRIVQVFIVKVPTGGLLYRPDGEPIADRTALSPTEAARLVFVPAPDFHGDPGPLQYMVQDAQGKLSAVATVSLTVTPVNDAPLPGTLPIGPDLTPYPDPDSHHIAGTPDYRWTTTADTPVFGQVNATDVDRDPMRFGTGTAPAHGQVLVAADGSFVYTPDAGWQGADRFVVTVDDGKGGIARSTVFIEVGTAGATGMTPAGLLTDASAAATPPADAHALAQPLDNPLSFDEIFGRAHLERAANHQVQPGSDVEADVLQLSALLVGHLPAAGSIGLPPDVRLDLGLDWGLRANGLDWLKNPPAQTLT